MVEEQGVVIALEGGDAWVETRRKAVCDTCSANKGCGTAVLSKALGNKRSRIKVPLCGDLPLRVGDEVVIGLQEQALLRGSMAVYGLPLLLMLAAALCGDYAGRHWLGMHAVDPLDITAGIGGFIAGLIWVKAFSRRVARDPRYQPVILSASTPAQAIHDNLAGIPTRLLT